MTAWRTAGRRLASRFTGRRRDLVWATLTSILQVIAVLPVPLLVLEVIDEALPQKRTGYLILLCVSMFALIVFSALMSIATSRVAARAASAVVKGLRLQAAAKLFELPISFYSTVDSSQVHDRMVHASDRLERVTQLMIAFGLPAAILTVGFTALLILINSVLALILIAVLPLIVLATRRLARRLYSDLAGYYKVYAQYSESALFLLRGIVLIRAIGADQGELDRHQAKLEELRVAVQRKVTTQDAYTATNVAVITSLGVIVLAVGGFAVINGSMTLGSLFSFYAALALMRTPLARVAGTAPALSEGVQSLAQLFELLDRADPVPYAGDETLAFSGQVVLDGVTFGYDPGRPVLRGVSLRLQPGQVLGLIGVNGSGKTTLANLILGFYRPQDGMLIADSLPYPALDMRALRQQMGLVPQDLILFPGSVYDNVAYGRPEVDREDVMQALALAGAGGMVEGLEHGLDTDVGHNGAALSGGMRQRVAIARAVVGRPRLLILDEPTNHLDAPSTVTVLHGLRALVPRPAVLLISHRPEVLSVANEVYHLSDGMLEPATQGHIESMAINLAGGTMMWRNEGVDPDERHR